MYYILEFSCFLSVIHFELSTRLLTQFVILAFFEVTDSRGHGSAGDMYANHAIDEEDEFM